MSQPAPPLNRRQMLTFAACIAGATATRSQPGAFAMRASPVPASPIPSPQTILDVTFVTAPAAPAFIGIARLLFPPGGVMLGGQIVGPRMLLIESGSIVVALAENAEIRHANGDQETATAAAEIHLVAGDQVILPGLPPKYLGATADNPSTLLDLVIWPRVTEPVRTLTTESGVIFRPLVIGEASVMPEGPIRTLLTSIPMPRQEQQKLVATGGPRLLVVESGKVGLSSALSEVSYAPSAGNNPGSVAGQPRLLDVGKEALLTAGGNAFLQSGATVTVRNLGRTTVELLSFEVLSSIPVAAIR